MGFHQRKQIKVLCEGNERMIGGRKRLAKGGERNKRMERKRKAEKRRGRKK